MKVLVDVRKMYSPYTSGEVTDFRYLGSDNEVDRDITMDVECRIARASRVFGAVRRTVFRDKDISLKTKRLVYRAVLGVLLYRAETWAKRVTAHKIDVFHNKCL